MKKSITVQVTTVAASEVLTDALNGLATVKRTINRIWFEQGADLRLRGYVNQERVIDSASDCEAFDHNPVECEIPLATGDTFKIGFQSDGSTAAAKYITVDLTED